MTANQLLIQGIFKSSTMTLRQRVRLCDLKLSLSIASIRKIPVHVKRQRSTGTTIDGEIYGLLGSLLDRLRIVGCEPTYPRGLSCVCTV